MQGNVPQPIAQPSRGLAPSPAEMRPPDEPRHSSLKTLNAPGSQEEGTRPGDLPEPSARPQRSVGAWDSPASLTLSR